MSFFCADIRRDSVSLLKFPFLFYVKPFSCEIIISIIIIITIIIYSLEFFISALADGFSLESSDNKSPQVSRTRLRILAVLSNAVVWIFSIRPPTSKSSRPFNNRLVIVPKVPITIGTIVTFTFHSLFQFSGKVEVLILLFTFLQIYSMAHRDSKADNFANALLYVDYYLVWSCNRDKMIRLYDKVP